MTEINTSPDIDITEIEALDFQPPCTRAKFSVTTGERLRDCEHPARWVLFNKVGWRKPCGCVTQAIAYPVCQAHLDRMLVENRWYCIPCGEINVYKAIKHVSRIEPL